MNRERMEYFRKLLLLEKRELLNQMKRNNRFGLNNPEQDHELSSLDNHPADTATELFEREKDLALFYQAESYLDEIDLALSRIEQGIYGLCEECGRPISEERLEVIPTARFCLEHQREVRDEVPKGRPIEEEALDPPYGTKEKVRREQAGTDDEDIWQMVEHFGTSDTPLTYGRGIEEYQDMVVENDEPVGYVDETEGFLVTDLYGRERGFVRNRAYEEYMDQP
ncbi:MAG: TraR/DksA C4-type zinc finger protein [Thermicanus sp.]|nr:TraR/DksA C4-type zinc finger protein [Thermicanus sp.]